MAAVNTPEGTEYLFCNGIMNSKKAAEESAGLISRCLGGRDVEVFHNPTTHLDVAAIFWRYQRVIDEQYELANALAKIILEKIREQRRKQIDNSSIRIVIFAHSHGAFLTANALAKLSRDNQQCTEVYCFGGATLIPKSMARVVHNCFNAEDLIAQLGNVVFNGTRESLSDFKRIFDLTKSGLTYREAIEEMARQSYVSKLTKDRQNQIRNNPISLQGNRHYMSKIVRYSTLLTTYNVHILHKPVADDSKPAAVSSYGDNIGSFFKNAQVVHDLIFGDHNFAKYDIFLAAIGLNETKKAAAK